MGTSFTQDGNVLGEAVSALQKSIRRAQTEDAVYFGHQIFAGFPYYCLKRLCVVAVEDIGLANLMLVERTLGMAVSLSKSVEFHRKAPRPLPYDVVVAQLIREMCESPKSREADHMVHEVLRERRTGQLKLPQEMSYEDLVACLVGEIVLQHEKPALNYLISLIDGYATWIWPEMTAMAAALIGDGLVTATMAGVTAAVLTFFEARQYYEGNFPAFATLLLCRSDGSTATRDVYNIVAKAPKRAIPDYALDMHTGRGKQMGRGFEYFINVGQHVENEAYPSAYTFYDPVYGTASVAADNKTKMKEPYAVSNASELGKRKEPPLKDVDPEPIGVSQSQLF